MRTTTSDARVIVVDDLLLRPWATGDEAVVLGAFTDPDVRHFAGNLVDTQAKAERFVTGRTRGWDEGTGASWAVTNRASGTVLGHLGLHEMDAQLQIAMVGYWLLPRGRGRGVAARALAAVSAYGFEVLGLHRVELAHALENLASCRVAERAGYPYEGTLRQAMRYPVDGRWSDEHLHARLASDPV